MPQRTEYEIAQFEQRMLNALQYGDLIFRDFPIRSPRMTAYIKEVQEILEERGRHLSAAVNERRAEEARITQLKPSCESLTGA